MGTRQPLYQEKTNMLTLPPQRNATSSARRVGVDNRPAASHTVISVLLTNHVLSGALIGALARRPAPAFAAGVASHFVLDAVPHWGDWGSIRRFLQVAVPDGLISLAAMGTLAALAPAERRPAVLAGMIGAALPDIDKPAKLWFGRTPWPRAVDEFHRRIQPEASGRAHIELLAASAFAAAALAALRQPSDPATRRAPRLL
jgi:hypothetical protein